jgi:hypothetical protein
MELSGEEDFALSLALFCIDRLWWRPLDCPSRHG